MACEKRPVVQDGKQPDRYYPDCYYVLCPACERYMCPVDHFRIQGYVASPPGITSYHACSCGAMWEVVLYDPQCDASCTAYKPDKSTGL